MTHKIERPTANLRLVLMSISDYPLSDPFTFIEQEWNIQTIDDHIMTDTTTEWRPFPCVSRSMTLDEYTESQITTWEKSR